MGAGAGFGSNQHMVPARVTVTVEPLSTLADSRHSELRNIEDLGYNRPERLSAGVIRTKQLLNRCTDHRPKRSFFGTHVDQTHKGLHDLIASRCIGRADDRLENTIDSLREFGCAPVLAEAVRILRIDPAVMKARSIDSRLDEDRVHAERQKL